LMTTRVTTCSLFMVVDVCLSKFSMQICIKKAALLPQPLN
jgi:hypothetical protein